METEVRRFDGDMKAWTTLLYTAFGGHVVESDLPVLEAAHEPERALAAYVDGRPVGGTGIFSFSLTVPGGELPAAGVTTVGVLPTHRRRGILRQLMRRQLEDVREAGEPLAMLWASEGSIYGRFGYGLATLNFAWEVERHRTAFRPGWEPAGRVRLVERDEAERLFPDVYDRYRPLRPGCYTRSAANWQAESFHDPEHARGGASPRFYAVHETDGRVDGYVSYRTRGDWSARGAAGRVEVGELLGLTSGAELDLWRYVFDIDLMTSTSAWNVPVDTPLPLWLTEPRRLGATLGDALWLRVVDVAAALEGRRYTSAGGSIAFALSDPFMPDNAGTWLLDAGADGARVTRTEGPPALELDTTDLAALYLGTFSVTRLVRAGRVRELRDGAAAAADAIFRTSVTPWCPKVF